MQQPTLRGVGVSPLAQEQSTSGSAASQPPTGRTMMQVLGPASHQPAPRRRSSWSRDDGTRPEGMRTSHSTSTLLRYAGPAGLPGISLEEFDSSDESDGSSSESFEEGAMVGLFPDG